MTTNRPIYNVTPNTVYNGKTEITRPFLRIPIRKKNVIVMPKVIQYEFACGAIQKWESGDEQFQVHIHKEHGVYQVIFMVRHYPYPDPNKRLLFVSKSQLKQYAEDGRIWFSSTSYADAFRAFRKFVQFAHDSLESKQEISANN